MDNIELAEDGSGVGGQDHLLQVVDDDLVAAVGSQGGLHGLRDSLAGFDVTDNGSIFGVVAGNWVSGFGPLGQIRRCGGMRASLLSYLW